ncbi:MAG: heterodisulfide reductase-related iron-sulfur binding cluster [Salinirussus sp.]
MTPPSSELDARLAEADPAFRAQIREDPVESTKTETIGALNQLAGLLVDLDDPGFVRTPQEYEGDQAAVDAVVHMGCHSIKTPVIVDATLDVVESLGYTPVGLGGFGNCCGIMDLKRGDVEAAEHADDNRFENIAAFDPEVAIAECTSCHAITSTLSLGYRDPEFAFPSFIEFLLNHVDELNDAIQPGAPVPVALHEHFDGRGWSPDDQPAKARELMNQLDGVELVEMGDEGIPCNNTGDPAAYDVSNLNDRILGSASSAGAEYVITFWHACQASLLYEDHAHPATAKNIATFLAERLGYEYRDVRREYVAAGARGELDWIVEDARPTFEANGLSEATARDVAQEYFVTPS